MIDVRKFFAGALTAAGCTVAAALCAPGAVASTLTPVEVELVILVDVAQSTSLAEFNLYRSALSAAFRSTDVQNAILTTQDGRLGSIAAEVVLWAGPTTQIVATDWALLNSVESILAFADLVDTAQRPSTGEHTSPGNALTFATNRLATNAYEGTQVIDVAGDGQATAGLNVPQARNAAFAAGVTRIDGLAIGNAAVTTYYGTNIVGGTESLLLTASSYSTLGDTVRLLLVNDILGSQPYIPPVEEEAHPVPLPASGPLLAAVAGAGAIVARRGSRRTERAPRSA